MFNLIPKSLLASLCIVLTAYVGYLHYRIYTTESSLQECVQVYQHYRYGVEHRAVEQQLENNQLIQEQEDLTEKIKAHYEEKLRIIRNTTFNGMRITPSVTNSSGVSKDSKSPAGTNEATSNEVFIRDATETTLQLITLQEWFNGIQKEHNERVEKSSKEKIPDPTS